MPSQFEWDDEKDRSNRAKHGIGFEEAKVIFASPVLTAPDERQDYGEERLSAMDHSVRWLSSLWFTPADVGEFG